MPNTANFFVRSINVSSFYAGFGLPDDVFATLNTHQIIACLCNATMNDEIRNDLGETFANIRYATLPN